MKRSSLIRVALLAVSIVGISLFHYLTPLHLPVLHDIFQRLYYIPIIFSAFWFGLRGGLATSIFVSFLYAPHILFQWGIDPSLGMEKFLEIVLYNVVGGVTGFLSQREEERRDELQRIARGLEESYRKLQSQADMIIGIEEQLRMAERMSALGEMSAVLAHEIRNPLGSIKGTAEILKDDFLPGDRKYEFLEILVREADRLNRVVEDFLQLARPVQVERETCDIMEQLESVVALVAPEAAARGVRLQLAPAYITPIYGYPERLKQAFLNLVLNGIQASTKGGTLTITASQQTDREGAPTHIDISFADTGEGMEPDVLARIFEPFYTTKEGGTGLGLAITQRIIESIGGKIGVESRKGAGTVFRIQLPV